MSLCTYWGGTYVWSRPAPFVDVNILRMPSMAATGLWMVDPLPNGGRSNIFVTSLLRLLRLLVNSKRHHIVRLPAYYLVSLFKGFEKRDGERQ